MANSFKQMVRPFFFAILLLAASCKGPGKPENTNDTTTGKVAPETGIDAFGAISVNNPGKYVNDILEDRRGNYWFATNGEGVFCYDGKTWKHYTAKDGLPNNQVQTVQEDEAGNIWFSVGGYRVSRFNGQTFNTVVAQEAPSSANNLAKNWKITLNDLWFPAGGGVYRYDGNSLTYLPLPKTDTDKQYRQEASSILGRYAVYCIFKDSKGHLWFGTQAMGVCRYDGHAFKWFTEKDLAVPAVRGLFEDSAGNMWFGKNGAGLFRYNGKLLSNFTREKGLSSPEFLKAGRISGKAIPGTLARVFAINQDSSGDIWIGTFDSGVWRYNGEKLTNYTTKDGLASNAVNIIYKDKKGELWFGTDGGGVSKFNGTTFSNFVFK